MDMNKFKAIEIFLWANLECMQHEDGESYVNLYHNTKTNGIFFTPDEIICKFPVILGKVLKSML